MMKIHKLVELTCDCCGHSCLFDQSQSPRGWATLTEDHSDIYCPECNPWLVRVSEPDENKLTICKAEK